MGEILKCWHIVIFLDGASIAKFENSIVYMGPGMASSTSVFSPAAV